MTEFNDEIEFGTIPEADRSLATEALEAIRDGDTDNALTKLNQLRLRRPNDPKVIHNWWVTFIINYYCYYNFTKRIEILGLTEIQFGVIPKHK